MLKWTKVCRWCCLLAVVSVALAEDNSLFDVTRPPVLPKIDAPAEAEIRSSIDRGVAFLIGKQNKNGSWGSPTRTKSLNIYAPVPGAHHAFRAACTSLCISALLETAGSSADGMAAVMATISPQSPE